MATAKDRVRRPAREFDDPSPSQKMADRIADAPGFVEVVFPDLDPMPEVPMLKTIAGKSNANEKSFEDGASVIPALVSAVVDILTVGAIHPHRSAIRRHLSDRALDAAISKLQSIRRD